MHDEEDHKGRTPPATSTYKMYRNSVYTQKSKKKEMSNGSQGMPQIAIPNH